MAEWKKLSSEIVHKNPWYRVRKDIVSRPDGTEGEYYIVQTPGPSVFVVAVTQQNEIYLVRQNRYQTVETYWEIPGGNAGDESPEVAAKRELQEETGLHSTELIPIGTANPMIGVTEEVCYFFLTTRFSQTGENKQAEEQIDRLKAFSVPEVLHMIQNGSIGDTQSMSAIFRAILYLGYKVEK